MKKIISTSLALAILLNVTACGTFLYPERKQQSNPGRIDPSIVILDGLGLLFFIIPGAVAFAVDFGNKTIYIPEDESSSLELKDMKVVKVDKDFITEEMAAKIVTDKTGKNFDISKAEIYKLDANGKKVRVE
jgi:hypothetical protein